GGEHTPSPSHSDAPASTTSASAAAPPAEAPRTEAPHAPPSSGEQGLSAPQAGHDTAGGSGGGPRPTPVGEASPRGSIADRLSGASETRASAPEPRSGVSEPRASGPEPRAGTEE